MIDGCARITACRLSAAHDPVAKRGLIAAVIDTIKR